MKRIVRLTLALGTVGLLALLLALTVGAQAPVHASGNIIKVPDDYPRNRRMNSRRRPKSE